MSLQVFLLQGFQRLAREAEKRQEVQYMAPARVTWDSLGHVGSSKGGCDVEGSGAVPGTQ